MVQDIADDYPDRFAPMTLHVNGDAYAVRWSQDRLDDFYGATNAVPTFMVDALWNCQSGEYRYYVEEQLGIPTDVTLELSANPVGGSSWDVTARVCLEGGAARSVRVFTAATLDDHPELPSYATNVLMQKPDSTDTTLGLGCQDITHRINFDPLSMSNRSDIVVVAWVQRQATIAPTDVYQAGIMRWPFPAGSQLDAIEVEPGDVTLNIGDTVVFSASGKDQSGQPFPLEGPTWSFGAGNGIGGFDPATGATTTFTATGAGTRQVLCTEDGVTGAAVVTIRETPRLDAIEIDPDPATIAVGGEIAFSATGRDQYGDVFDLTEPAWTVSGTGDGVFAPTAGTTTTFTASYPGAATVTCTEGAVSAAAAIEVTGDDPVLETITVSPAAAQLRIGDELELTAAGADQYGRTVELTDATWRIEGDGDGVFDPADGAATTFTATDAGSAQLICTADGIDGAASVEITGTAPPAPRRASRRVAPQ